MVEYKKYIEIDPDVRFGKPVLKGTRISVYDIRAWLAQGMSVQDILNDFPELKEEQITACLAYAAERENKMRVVG